MSLLGRRGKEASHWRIEVCVKWDHPFSKWTCNNYKSIVRKQMFLTKQPLGSGVFNQLKSTWKITQDLWAPEIKGVIRIVAWKTHLEAYETNQPGIKNVHHIYRQLHTPSLRECYCCFWTDVSLTKRFPGGKCETQKVWRHVSSPLRQWSGCCVCQETHRALTPARAPDQTDSVTPRRQKKNK